GLGSRLRPITNHIPKCMVPILDKPLLDYWLELLVPNQDIDEIFINVCYLKDVVVTHLERHWRHCEKITIWYETELLGTAGTLRKNIHQLTSEDTLIIHADNLSKFNLNAFIHAHHSRPLNCEGTMMLFKTDSPSSCGIVELDTHNRVLKMHEKVKMPPGDLANGAVYIFSQTILECIKESEAFEISADVIPSFLGKLFSWKNSIYHRDIGNPTSYQLASKEYKQLISI
ncbi:nucleotidyltransferase family protein, partial [Paraglaciecola sp.]|uniref:nucleotidyltransferase family protein n=1 Tax=Paraglaciecola sp. TaxID=1920173 RepID=UPI003EF7BF2F